MTLFLLLLSAVALCVSGMVAMIVYSLIVPPRLTFGLALARGLPTEAAEVGLAAEELSFTLTEDIQSPGWLLTRLNGETPQGDETQTSGGWAVLLVHGYSDGRLGMLRHAAMLLDAGASFVCVYDQRAHGEAGGGNHKAGKLEAGDALNVLDHVRMTPQGRAVEHWFFMGISAGSGVVMRAAVQAKDRPDLPPIKGVIVEGTYRFWQDAVRQLMRRRRWPTWPAIPLASMVAPFFGVTRSDFDRVGWASQLEQPLLMIHGSEDEVCPIESAQQVYEGAKQANVDVQWITVEGAGHMNVLQLGGMDYLNAVRDFVEEQIDGR